MGNDKNIDEYDWIESVVKVAESVGMNPVRVRWKLRGWQDKMKASRKRLDTKKEAVTRKHKTCPKCRAINSYEDKVCHSCGAKLLWRPLEITDRFLRHFSLGFSAETFLALSFVISYAIIIFKGQASNLLSTNPYDLMRMGGSSFMMVVDGNLTFTGYAAALKSKPYMLWTSVFLHGGIFHLFFNTYALMYITPFARKVFNSGKVMTVFIITGLGASAISLIWTYRTFVQYGYPPMRVSIGASGAISGLIGLMLVWGHRDGTFSGVATRNNMIRWVFYILIFGHLVGADNAAHMGGLVAGGVMALLMKPDFERGESGLWRIWGMLTWLAVAAAVLIIATLAFATTPLDPKIFGY